jgi:hypothetical protein
VGTKEKGSNAGKANEPSSVCNQTPTTLAEAASAVNAAAAIPAEQFTDAELAEARADIASWFGVVDAAPCEPSKRPPFFFRTREVPWCPGTTPILGAV